ncbi:MAG: hypothetical protein GXO39_08725 [Thermotogae bacterium]|nr:hypothetical protein [Thermotogota bacterium]
MDVQRVWAWIEKNRSNVVFGGAVLAIIISGILYHFYSVIQDSRSKEEEVQILYIRAMIGDPYALNRLKDLVASNPNTFWGKMAALDLMFYNLFQGKEKSAAGYIRFLEKAKNRLLKSAYYSHASSFKLNADNPQEALDLLREGERGSAYRSLKDYFLYRRAEVLFNEGRLKNAEELLRSLTDDYDSAYREDAQALLRKVELLKGVE